MKEILGDPQMRRRTYGQKLSETLNNSQQDRQQVVVQCASTFCKLWQKSSRKTRLLRGDFAEQMEYMDPDPLGLRIRPLVAGTRDRSAVCGNSLLYVEDQPLRAGG